MTVGKALEQAGANLASIRDDCMAGVVEAVSALEALILTEPDDPGARLDEVYKLSAGVLEAAGPVGMEDLSAAAFSLCDLADRLLSSGRYEPASIAVHVRSLRLLLQLPEDAAAGRREVLAGLDRVVARVPKPVD
jgi:hypothetical protein